MSVCSIFSDTLLQKHKQSLSELIRRDKNRPSVIIWSVANEPRTQTTASGVYFKWEFVIESINWKSSIPIMKFFCRQIVDHVKSLDASRPTTIALARSVSEDKVVSKNFWKCSRCLFRYNYFISCYRDNTWI